MDPMVKLSRRQLEVARLLAQGASNKEVAGALAISARTVQCHRALVMEKLGARNPVELGRLLLEGDELG